MHIKWRELKEFHPKGWAIQRYDDSDYKTPPGFVSNLVAPEAVGLWRSKDDVVVVICLAINSICTKTPEQKVPLTKNMLYFIRHALWVHFESTMVILADRTIQEMARYLPN